MSAANKHHSMSPPDNDRWIKMFGCDTARISKPMGRMFLIIGWKRNTRQDAGQWVKNDEPWDFDYVQEKVIASGSTLNELLASAREYKRLLRIIYKEQRRTREVTHETLVGRRLCEEHY